MMYSLWSDIWGMSNGRELKQPGKAFWKKKVLGWALKDGLALDRWGKDVVRQEKQRML